MVLELELRVLVRDEDVLRGPRLVRARVRARVNPNPSPNPSQVATSGEAATFVLYARDARGVPVGFGGEKFEVAMQRDPDPDPALTLGLGPGRILTLAR